MRISAGTAGSREGHAVRPHRGAVGIPQLSTGEMLRSAVAGRPSG